MRPWLFFVVVGIAGCSSDGVLKGICNGNASAGRPFTITALATSNPESAATVDALSVVDRDDHPRAFMGVAQGETRGALYVFATDPGDGYLKLQLDGDSHWVYFAFEIAPMTTKADAASCEYTFPSDPP